MYKSRIVSLIFFTILFSACAGKHAGIKEDRPFTLSSESSPSLYEYAKEDILSKAPMTGFYPLENHLDSLTARVLLCKAAQKRITVQYFTFHGDGAGAILTKELIDAADRGVKVDVLIDDIDIAYDDDDIAIINAHKNIQVRVFNPTNYRRALHYVEMGIYHDKVGRRMHNKSFTADNSMAVFGGRNIGDIYFALDTKSFFIDNDVLAAGPLVNDITNQFDIYFNNALSVDFEEIAQGHIADMQTLLQRYTEGVTSKDFLLLKEAIQSRAFYKSFLNKELTLYFGNAQLFYDMPQKITTHENNTTYQMRRNVPEKIYAKKCFYMVSPYFIPNESVMSRLQRMIDKGVDVKILTNSLESSDQTSVYAYYAQYHKRLLEMGVKLYEVHPYAFEKDILDQHYNHLKKMPRASLHAKTTLIDDDIFAIGSVNMDPRSRKLNTELVGFIQSEALNTYEKVVFDIMTSPRNAYALSLEYDEDNNSKVAWKAIIQGESRTFYHDGDASLWLRMVKNLSLWFPIRDFL